jgi:hypothetical protein
MDPKEKNAPASGTRIATTESRKEAVEFALNRAESHVSRMRPSPAARCLKLSLQALRRTVNSWSIRVPTEEQLRFLGERVAELLELAESSAPTIRLNAAIGTTNAESPTDPESCHA